MDTPKVRTDEEFKKVCDDLLENIRNLGKTISKAAGNDFSDVEVCKNVDLP